MTRRPTTCANPARLVKCQQCRVLVWLAGALPLAGDLEFVCDTCKMSTAAPLSAADPGAASASEGGAPAPGPLAEVRP